MEERLRVYGESLADAAKQPIGTVINVHFKLNRQTFGYTSGEFHGHRMLHAPLLVEHRPLCHRATTPLR